MAKPICKTGVKIDKTAREKRALRYQAGYSANPGTAPVASAETSGAAAEPPAHHATSTLPTNM